MPAARRLPRRALLAYAALVALFALSLTYRLRDTVDRVDEMRHGTTYARLPFGADFPHLVVTTLRPEAEKAGLRAGDAVAGVDGRSLEGVIDLLAPLRDARAGDRLNVQVRSPSAQAAKTISIELQPIRTGAPTPYDWVYFALVNIAMPYLCVALGFWVAAVRVRDGRAWLLLVLLLGLAEFAGYNWRTLYGRDDWFQPVAVTYQPLLANLWPTTMMLFGLYFPDRLPFDRRAPWAKWLVIAPLFVRVLGTNVATDLLILHDIRAAVAVDRLFAWMFWPATCLHLTAIVTFFTALRHRFVTESSPDARRRLGLIAVGAAISVTPSVVVILLQLAGVQFGEWVLLPLLGSLFVFPVTIAYVIVVHRAMDVRVVVRQGVQYLLARGSLRALQAVLSVLVIAAATMSAAANPVGRVALISIGLAGVVLLQTSADRVRRFVDRRFFRESYDAERVLSELAQRVRTIVETGPLLETVGQRVSDTLHVPRVAILLNGGGTLQPAYALGYAQVPSIAVPYDGLTVDAERVLQEALGSELLLPLSSNQKLVGVMSLGPKRSEEPYSSSDLRLLDAVAAQTGLALENSRLTAEIASEVARREKAHRELEIAREVQQRLFPQEYPPIAGLDYAGACRPALGVGGDYYDFVRISDGALGIAIGDVSGKGIPAALLMATLRAYLRGQTIRGEADLAAMMANLNELVYESSAANRYATFFYGQYDAATHTLRYVNGGHNPPLVFRKHGRDPERLDTGGPVIGLMEACRYAQGSVVLEPGDVLVAFTDGVTEALNGADEDWGEEQLVNTVRPNAGIAASQLIDRLMQAVDGFVAGAPQYDDMTLVVVRVV